MPWIKQLHPLFAAEIGGIDLSNPVNSATVREIEGVIDQYAVVVFHDQSLSDRRQIQFSRMFGPLEEAAVIAGKKPRLRSRELFDISNLNENGEILNAEDERRKYKVADQLWHTDRSFAPIPARYSLLSARVIPPQGGETEFADMRAAYDALPAPMKATLDGLVAEHSIWHSRAQLGNYTPSASEVKTRPPAFHALVRVHAGSKRKTLYLASHASGIVGWPLEQGRALLRELMEFATQRQFVYRHHWRVRDLVIWDNRCTMHHAMPFDSLVYRRDMRRTSVSDAA